MDSQLLYPRTAYRLVEGGGVYTVEYEHRYFVVTTENTLCDFFDEDKQASNLPEHVIEFSDEAQRTAYLLHRFGVPNCKVEFIWP